MNDTVVAIRREHLDVLGLADIAHSDETMEAHLQKTWRTALALQPPYVRLPLAFFTCVLGMSSVIFFFHLPSRLSPRARSRWFNFVKHVPFFSMLDQFIYSVLLLNIFDHPALVARWPFQETV